jgi:hypothetical protein
VDRLYPRLVRAFGENRVFKDVESIPLGADFGSLITEVLAKSKVVLVIIGDQWLSVRDEYGSRRIDREDHPVRIEISTALTADKSVVPIAVGTARFPAAAELPAALMSCRRGMDYRSARIPIFTAM